MAIAEETPGPRVPAIDKHDRMRITREKAGYSSLDAFARELSAVLGFRVAGSTVGAWERGTNQPSRHGLTETKLLQAWAKVTGFDLHWLTYGGNTIMAWNADSAGRVVDLTDSHLGLVPPTRDFEELILPFDTGMSGPICIVNDVLVG